jgi:hypothetical protein
MNTFYDPDATPDTCKVVKAKGMVDGDCAWCGKSFRRGNREVVFHYGCILEDETVEWDLTNLCSKKCRKEYRRAFYIDFGRYES